MSVLMQIDCFYSSSAANLYRVSNGGAPLLLECGVRLREIKRVLNFGLSKIAACLLTHSHMDHARGAEELMRYGTDLYCSNGTAEALGLSGHRLHIVEPLKQFSIEDWRILPFPTEHDAPDPLGFLLQSGAEKLLFLTDSYYCRYRFQGLTHIMIECNWSKQTLAPDIDPAVKKRLLRSHFSLENVKKFLQANDLSRVQQIILIHLSRDNSNAELFKSEIERMTGKPVLVAPEAT